MYVLYTAARPFDLSHNTDFEQWPGTFVFLTDATLDFGKYSPAPVFLKFSFWTLLAMLPHMALSCLTARFCFMVYDVGRLHF
jgi:hypothetical protein